MQMIYGSFNLVNDFGQGKPEKEHTAGMMDALASYPWQSGSLCGLKNGALGVHTFREKPAAILERDGLTLTADVRLDNRSELCTALGFDAVQQNSLDDAELILRAYQHWGVDCPAHLLGDFAFALWDEKNARLFCARDFIGVRPFYYYHKPGRFIFASDLLALSAHSDVPMQLNLAYVAAALQLPRGQFMHPEKTYYQAIQKLPPAHCLSMDASGLHCWAYWQPGQTPERRYADPQDYVDELRTLLRAAVACRVSSSHPIGAHLSGGLDSSSVAVMAHRILQEEGRQVTGFSWAPPLPDDPAELLSNDERKLVEAVRVAEGLPLRYLNLTPAHILAYASRDITLQPTTTLQLELAASEDAASLGIRTMLSGWGGDELVAFNGRGYFPDLFRRGRWRTLQRELTLRAQLHGGTAWKSWINDGIFPFIPDAVLKLLRPEDFPPMRALPGYLCPEFAAALETTVPLHGPELQTEIGVRKSQIALLLHGHLSYRMESWASHGATLGLTYVYPLLDRRLVEFALSIPDYFFFKDGWKRYLYRTAMEGILPDSLRWNKKKEDPAMAQMLRGTNQAAEKQMQIDLLAQADNPYVDVERLQAALDSESGFREKHQDNRMTQAQRRRLLFQISAGRGFWLTFINPKAKA